MLGKMARWLCPFICMLLVHKTVGQVFVGPVAGSGAQATQKVQKQAMDAPTALRLHRYRDLSFEANSTTIVFLDDAEAAAELSGCVVVGALATGLRAEDEYLKLVRRGAAAVVWFSRRPAVTLGWSALQGWPDLSTQGAVADSTVPCVEVSRADAETLRRLAAEGRPLWLQIQPTPSTWLQTLHGPLWVAMARVAIPAGFCGVACLSIAAMAGVQTWRSTRCAAATIELVQAALLAVLFACDCWGDALLPRQVVFFFVPMLPGCRLATTLLLCGRGYAHAAAREGNSGASSLPVRVVADPLATHLCAGMAGIAGLVGLDVAVGCMFAMQGASSVVWAACVLTAAVQGSCGLFLMWSCRWALGSPSAANGPRRQLRATARYLAASSGFIVSNAACGLAVAIMDNPYEISWRLTLAAGLALTWIGMAACQLSVFVPWIGGAGIKPASVVPVPATAATPPADAAAAPRTDVVPVPATAASGGLSTAAAQLERVEAGLSRHWPTRHSHPAPTTRAGLQGHDAIELRRLRVQQVADSRLNHVIKNGVGGAKMIVQLALSTPEQPPSKEVLETL